jgi:hypothetical protein
MKTDKVVKKLGAGAKNNTECQSFSYSIRSFHTVFSNYGTNPMVFSVEFVVYHFGLLWFRTFMVSDFYDFGLL